MNKTFLVLAVLFVSPALAEEEIAGLARVIDGDTIVIDRHHIRIEGIDAPGRHQTCTGKTKNYPCGEFAKQYLVSITRGKQVVCLSSGHDRYQRDLAHCYVSGVDIGAAMVRMGWALAYVQYSSEYLEYQQMAQTEKLGLWLGSFVEPRLYRKGRKRKMPALEFQE